MKQLDDKTLNSVFEFFFPLMLMTGKGVKKAPSHLKDKFLKEFGTLFFAFYLLNLLLFEGAAFIFPFFVLPILLRLRWKPHFDNYN